MLKYWKVSAMEEKVKWGRKHIGMKGAIWVAEQGIEKRTCEYRSQGGEGLLVTLDRTTGKCLTRSRDSQVAHVAYIEGSMRREGGSEQGGNWGRGGGSRCVEPCRLFSRSLAFPLNVEGCCSRVLLSKWVTWSDLCFNKITGCCVDIRLKEGKVGQWVRIGDRYSNL